MCETVLEQKVVLEELGRALATAVLGLQGAGHGQVAGLQVHQQDVVVGESVPAQIASEKRW